MSLTLSLISSLLYRFTYCCSQLVSPCARRLVPRWMALALFAHVLVLGIISLATGHVPTSALMDKADDTAIQLSFELSRVWDPLLTLVPFAILVWLLVDGDLMRERFGAYTSVFPVSNYVWDHIIGWGVFFGLCGSIIVSFTGLTGIVIGVSICSLIIVIMGRCFTENPDPHIPYRLTFGVEAVACLVIWCTMSVFAGAVVGFTYGFAALTVAAIVHFGSVGIVKFGAWCVMSLADPFERNFLACDPASENC